MNGRKTAIRRSLKSVAACALVAVASLLATTGASAATITGVSFSGSSAEPKVTVTGEGFGKILKSYSAAKTSCGEYGPGNGSWWGTQYSKNTLWLQDDTNNWLAGAGNTKGGTCIGVIVDSWSATQVAFHFGIAYGSFDHWTLESGNNFVVAVKGYYWGGVVSGLS